MAKTGTLSTFCYDTTHNGEYAEVEDEVTYSSSLGDGDFASERIPRENLFLVGANTIYGRAVKVNIRYIT